MQTERPAQRTSLYRVEVGGRVSPERCAWLEADAVEPAGANTVLLVRVADQAELIGRLRRIHDLNLTLVSLTCVGPEHDESDN